MSTLLVSKINAQQPSLDGNPESGKLIKLSTASIEEVGLTRCAKQVAEVADRSRSMTQICPPKARTFCPCAHVAKPTASERRCAQEAIRGAVAVAQALARGVAAMAGSRTRCGMIASNAERKAETSDCSLKDCDYGNETVPMVTKKALLSLSISILRCGEEGIQRKSKEGG